MGQKKFQFVKVPEITVKRTSVIVLLLLPYKLISDKSVLKVFRTDYWNDS